MRPALQVEDGSTLSSQSLEPNEPISILCFGDANTWGRVAGASERRFGRGERWTGILQRRLGDGFFVIEDGHPDRTSVWDDPINDAVNGRQHLGVSLACHRPLDAVVLMLGSTDLRPRHRVTPQLASEGLAELCRIVLASEAWPGAGGPQLVLVGAVGADNPHGKRIEELNELISALALHFGCSFVAPDPSPRGEPDGGYLDRGGHQSLAANLESTIRPMFAVG